MSEKEFRHVDLRISREVHQKIRYIAQYEGRSLNSQIYTLILSCIRNFEKANGPIEPENK